MLRSLLAISLAVTIAGSARAEDRPPAIDPKAMEIGQASLEFLQAQSSMGFSWFITYDRIFEGREKITFIRSGSSLIARGSGYRSYAESGNTVREYIYDGKQLTISAPVQGFYTQTPISGDFDALVETAREQAGLVLPVWQIMSTKATDFLSEVEAASYLGTTLVNGREAHHLAFSEYRRDFQVWVSTDPERPVPLIFVETDPYTQGWPQYHAFLYDWNLEPEIEANSFIFTPGEGVAKISFSTLQTDPESGTLQPTSD
ncbi:MAG: DUF2092 domain-containing protein [Pseudomonadota bacterium]